jgi:hypothetical protein
MKSRGCRASARIPATVGVGWSIDTIIFVAASRSS